MRTEENFTYSIQT